MNTTPRTQISVSQTLVSYSLNVRAKLHQVINHSLQLLLDIRRPRDHPQELIRRQVRARPRSSRPRLAGSGSSAPNAVAGVWSSSFAEGDDVVAVDPVKRDAALVRGRDHDALVAAGRLAGDEPGRTLLQPRRHRLARIRDPLDPRRVGAQRSSPSLDTSIPTMSLSAISLLTQVNICPWSARRIVCGREPNLPFAC